MRRKLWTTISATLIAAASFFLITPPTASATTLNDSSAATSHTQLTRDDVLRGLDIIQQQTTGIDGRFNYSKLVASGVPSQIAIEYAGALKAAGVPYTAPPAVEIAINAAATKFKPSIQAARNAGVVTQNIDWGNVLRVVASEAECEFIRMTVFAWWPFAYCILNPDGNGTWLVIAY